MKRFDFVLVLLMTMCVSSIAQPRFQYKRIVSDVEQGAWYSLVLPPDLYKDVNRDMSDIRLYALQTQDTVELPYILDVRAKEVIAQTVDLRLFNKSFRDGVLYLTFELNGGQKVNYIDLIFHDLNYFGLVSLEGSDDRKQWFQIVKDQRIVSIGNGVADYNLSTVNFPMSDYRFLRFSVKSDVPLNFRNASFQYQTVKPGNYNEIPMTWTLHHDKKTKRSIVDIKLSHYVPLSFIKVETDTAGLFYRPMQIEYVRDSSRTDKGWIKYYQTLYDGYLTSYEKNEFDFDWVIAREIRLVMLDSDNPPLKIAQISARGPQVHLISYLEPGRNFMLYGAREMASPSYDLVHFETELVEATRFASLGSPEKIAHRPGADPLFENKLWLWGLMGLMILGLGFFTIRMMKQKGAST